MTKFLKITFFKFYRKLYATHILITFQSHFKTICKCKYVFFYSKKLVVHLLWIIKRYRGGGATTILTKTPPKKSDRFESAGLYFLISFRECLSWSISRPFLKFEKVLHMCRYSFSSNHNVHKSLCDLCIWSPDPVINRFY